MIRFVFRFLAIFFLAIATIMAVLDATRTVAAKTLVLTPLQESWQATWPDGLTAVQTFLTDSVHRLAWDPVATVLLGLPGCVTFGALAFLLYAISRKPQRRIGRFAVGP